MNQVFTQFWRKHSPSHLTVSAFIELVGISGRVIQSLGFASTAPAYAVSTFSVVHTAIDWVAQACSIGLWSPVTTLQQVLLLGF